MLRLLIALLIFSCFGFSHHSFAKEEKQYTIGIVPQYGIEKIVRIWTPILKEIKKETGISLRFLGAKDIPTFEKRLNEGAYDFAYMNPYHLIVANRSQGYSPLLKDNMKKLYGIVVVRKDSPIKSVSELNGKRVAYPAPNALGAALMTRTIFANQFNIDTDERYVKSHDSVYLNVITGIASAGGGVQKTLNGQPEHIKSKLRVIFETPRVAPHPIAVHPRVSSDDVTKIENAILTFSTTQRGAKLFAKIPMKSVGKASLSDYLPLKNMGLEKLYVEG